MSGDAIERILSDFRAWLVELSQLPSPSVEPPAIELHTLVAQFTALRHEVNLQTRAARSTLEQNGEALSQLRTAVEQLQEQPEADDELDPLLKAVVDVYDNLALALRQVERQRETIESPLRELTESPSLAASNASPAKRGLLSSLFGKGAARDPDRAMTARPQTLVDASKQIRSSFNGLIAGYRMSLARVERILEQYELTPIETVGEAFDPEYMEVVEVVGDSGKPAGTVMEEVRRGYVRDDVVFRYAQVKVAR